MRLPAIQGVIDRRILANYRVEPDAAAAQLPPPFRPKLVNGYAIAGICLIRLKQVRPAFMPKAIGLTSENAAHRFAVAWDADGETREGVYVPRRDTDSRLNTLAGGRLFPGAQHHASFTVHEDELRLDVRLDSDDGEIHMHVEAEVADALPVDSVFPSLEYASAFFEAGSLGYSATRRADRFDGMELCCEQWSVTALRVTQVASSFFDDVSKFPAGSATFDHALLMRGIQHQWQSRPTLCCDEAGQPDIGSSPAQKERDKQ